MEYFPTIKNNIMPFVKKWVETDVSMFINLRLTCSMPSLIHETWRKDN